MKTNQNNAKLLGRVITNPAFRETILKNPDTAIQDYSLSENNIEDIHAFDLSTILKIAQQVEQVLAGARIAGV